MTGHPYRCLVTADIVGQRVAVPWLGYACGTCKYCLTGREARGISWPGPRSGTGAWSGMRILSDAGYRASVLVSLTENHASND